MGELQWDPIPKLCFAMVLTICKDIFADCKDFFVMILQIGVVPERENFFLFNDALNAFYLRLYGVRHMVKDHSDSEREATRCCHMGYSFRLAARVLLYAPSHRQNKKYHSLCYTSRGALAGTRNSSIGSTPWRIDPTTHRSMSERSYRGATSRSCWMEREIAQWVHTMENRSDDPSHHERTLLPRSYISLITDMSCPRLTPRDRTHPSSFLEQQAHRVAVADHARAV